MLRYMYTYNRRSTVVCVSFAVSGGYSESTVCQHNNKNTITFSSLFALRIVKKVNCLIDNLSLCHKWSYVFGEYARAMSFESRGSSWLIVAFKTC